MKLRAVPFKKRLATFERRLVDARQGALYGKNQPSHLCHYTGLEGILGILKEQRFRATDHNDLDDPKELQAAEPMVDFAVKHLQTTHPEWTGLLAKFWDRYSQLPVAKVITAYFSCFTAVEDCLYHWKTFAKCGGCCMVLRCLPEELPNRHGRHEISRGARSVIYDPTELETVMIAGFEAILREHEHFTRRAMSRTELARADHRACVELAVVASSLGVFSKRPEFKPEQEWRYVAFFDQDSPDGPVPSVHVSKDGKPKRYLPLLFRAEGRRLEIDRIILRSVDHADAEARIQKAAAAAGYPNPLVVTQSVHSPKGTTCPAC